MADIYISQNIYNEKKKKRRIFLILITLASVLAFVLVGIVISSFVKANQIMKEESQELSPFAANLLPDYSNVSFQTLKGDLNLYGWWINAQTEETLATVILVHSQGMNRLPFGLDSVDLFDNLTKAGCAVLTFDLRNSAESDGSLSSFGYMESDDVLAALKYAYTAAPNRPVVLFGVGSGTAAVLRAMIHMEEVYKAEDNKTHSDESELCNPDIVSALILDTPARSSDDFIAAKIAKEQSFGRYFLPRTVPLAIRLSSDNKAAQDYLSYLSQLTVPVLLLGYERDNLLPENAYMPLWAERERTHPSLTQTFQAKGSGHLTAFNSESGNYSKAVTDFINLWF